MVTGRVCVNYHVFLSLNVVLILAISVDPDEMQHYAAFHLGLHCLPKYPSRGIQYTKGELEKQIDRKEETYMVEEELFCYVALTRLHMSFRPNRCEVSVLICSKK